MIALIHSHDNGTLAQLIASRSPTNENATARIIAEISLWTGIDPSTMISDLSDAQVDALGFAINRSEGGHPGVAYTPDNPDTPPCLNEVFDYLGQTTTLPDPQTQTTAGTGAGTGGEGEGEGEGEGDEEFDAELQGGTGRE